MIETRIAKIDANIAASRRQRAQILEHRDEYRRIDNEMKEKQAAYLRWKTQLGPLAQALILEENDRGIHFAVTKKPTLATKPSAPASLTLVVACLAFACGAGVICVLIAELADRSFRTTKQLSVSLGVPVIETIDEIVTRAMRKKRLIRRFVLLPATTVVLAAVATFAGSMAWLSLEDPARHNRIKTMPNRAVEHIVGRG